MTMAMMMNMMIIMSSSYNIILITSIILIILIILPPMQQQQRHEESELTNGKVSRVRGMSSFAPADADAHARGLDHAHVVGAVADGEGYRRALPTLHHAHERSLLKRRHATRHYSGVCPHHVSELPLQTVHITIIIVMSIVIIIIMIVMRILRIMMIITMITLFPFASVFIIVFALGRPPDRLQSDAIHHQRQRTRA